MKNPTHILYKDSLENIVLLHSENTILKSTNTYIIKRFSVLTLLNKRDYIPHRTNKQGSDQSYPFKQRYIELVHTFVPNFSSTHD